MFSWYLSSSKTFLFHLEEDGKCIGYCGAMVVDGSWPAGSTSSVVRYSFMAGVFAVLMRPWLLLNREAWEKWPLFWNNLKYKIGLIKKNIPTNSGAITQVEPSVGLIVIGVHPDYQGKGYGTILLQEFERRAITEYGIRKFHLSVRADNQQAIRVYAHAGWIEGEHQGSSLTMYKEV
jgi:ribosomal protein S18 acetylase RimI-like enzyme